MSCREENHNGNGHNPRTIGRPVPVARQKGKVVPNRQMDKPPPSLALADPSAPRQQGSQKSLPPFLQPQPGELIQNDQKILSAKRKLVSKLDRLGKAFERKKESWQYFRAHMKEHLTKEQARFDLEVIEIENAVVTTQGQPDWMMNGEAEDRTMEADPPEEDLEKLLHAEKETIKTRSTAAGGPHDKTAAAQTETETVRPTHSWQEN